MSTGLFEAAGIILRQKERIVKRGRFKGKVPIGLRLTPVAGPFSFFGSGFKKKAKWKDRKGELILTNMRLIAVTEKLEPSINLELEKLLAVAKTTDDKLQLSLPLGTEITVNMAIKVDEVSEWVDAIRSIHAQVGRAEVETQKLVSVSLKKCPQCGTRFSQEYSYCSRCGTKLEPA